MEKLAPASDTTTHQTNQDHKTVSQDQIKSGPRNQAKNLLRRQAANTRDEMIDVTLASLRRIGSPGYPFEEEYLRDLSQRSMERGSNPQGYLRQLEAVVVQPDRTKQLRTIKVPTVVMHGLNDPLIRPSGGLALAKQIPGARFVGFAGMGHDLPSPLWNDIARELVLNADRATG